MIVVDASVVAHWLLETRSPLHRTASRLGAEMPLAAPHLLDAEVGHVIRRHTLVGIISTVRAKRALEDFAAIPIDRYPHTSLLPRAFSLRDNATMYDALYLALAETLDATFLTRDAALAGVPGVAARVEVIADG